MRTDRMESFSDGVIAVAITLLVLGIRIPGPGGPHGLIHKLLEQWPSYAAYVTSFITIGIIWINHHAMLDRLQRSDHVILILNLVLLMSIGVIPFATGLMAEYLRQSSGEDVAAAVYSGSFLVMAIAFAFLNRAILLGKAGHIDTELSLEQRRAILRRSILGLLPYALATALAFVSPYLTLGICAVLAAYYAHPAASGIQSSA